MLDLGVEFVALGAHGIPPEAEYLTNSAKLFLPVWRAVPATSGRYPTTEAHVPTLEKPSTKAQKIAASNVDNVQGVRMWISPMID